MEKPKTTQQHLLDKFMLGKLPLHERHQKMRQFGSKGDRDPNLDKAMAQVEIDDSHCANLQDHCGLRAKQFLTMATIVIEQMDNELHREVAKHVLNKLQTEGNRFLDLSMEYTPTRESEEILEKFGSLENYSAALKTNYQQVAFENRVSMILSAIPQRIQKHSRAEVTDSQFNLLCRLIDHDIHAWQKPTENKIYLSSIAITPEEYSELHSILAKNNLDDWLFENAVMIAKGWLDEIQSKYDPAVQFYNSYFNDRVKKRVTELFRDKTERPIGEKEEYTDTDSHYEDIKEHMINGSDLDDDHTDNMPLEAVEENQARSIIQAFAKTLTPKRKRIFDLYLRGYSREEIAEIINDEFPETFKGSGEAKPFNPSNVQYALNKVEELLEQWLRKGDVLSDDETFPGLTRDYKSTKDHNTSDEEGNHE